MKNVCDYVINKPLYQYMASFSALLITICAGLHFGWTSPYLPILLNEDSPIPMTKEQSSWVAVVYLIAGPCGALTAGLTLNVFGRKSILMCSSILFLVSWLMLAFVGSLEQLLMARFIAGTADGLIFGTTSVYLAEILEKKIRGFVCSFISIFYVFGALLINILGTYLNIRDSSLVIATLPIAFLLIFVWMPESPIFLLMKGETEKARKCLEKLRCSIEVNEELEDIAKSIEEDAGVTFLHLFSSKMYRRSLLVVMGMRFNQQLSGIVPIVFYAQTVFKEATDMISPLEAVVILHTVQIICSIISSFFIDKIGRKPLLIVSITVTALTLLVEGTFFYLRSVGIIHSKQVGWLPVGSTILFIIAFSLGLQMIPVFIAGEIFPSNLRSHAAALSEIYFCLFAFVVSKFFQATKDAYGLHVPFFTFSVCSVVGLIILIHFVPETKNKTLHEIQLELKMLHA